HLARKLSLRRKRSSPNVFEMAATETITSIILIKLIRVSLGTVRHPRRSYGYSMPIAVRYTQDAFSRSGWLWPVDAKGEPLKATSYMAVGFYVAKYVNKKSDMDLAAKGLGAKEWNNSLKTKLSLLPKKLFRI